MKIGLILAGNIWYAPYMNIYIRILKEMGVEYDIISWNRDGRDAKQGYQYNAKHNKGGCLSKLLSYIQYASFVKNVVNRNCYDKLVIFGPHISIFLSNFLRRKYTKRYILDYRDLSIEQFPIFKYIFKDVLKNSYANVISSFGYKKVLPQGFDYILSHNFDVGIVKKALIEPFVYEINSEQIKVLTIGGIRNYEANIEVVKALENEKGFELLFVGKGNAGDMIKEYGKMHRVQNLSVVGYYPKEKEETYVKDCSFMNIYFPKVISHSTILSNRLYLALIYKKPMIVTSNSTQGDYIEQYQLGLSIENCENLGEKLKEYLKTLDYNAFCKRCDCLLMTFLCDYEKFEQKVKEFVNL